MRGDSALDHAAVRRGGTALHVSSACLRLSPPAQTLCLALAQIPIALATGSVYGFHIRSREIALASQPTAVLRAIPSARLLLLVVCATGRVSVTMARIVWGEQSVNVCLVEAELTVPRACLGTTEVAAVQFVLAALKHRALYAGSVIATAACAPATPAGVVLSVTSSARWRSSTGVRTSVAAKAHAVPSTASATAIKMRRLGIGTGLRALCAPHSRGSMQA